MRVFVSGATGFIGTRLVSRLVEEGNTVHALVRSEKKADPIRMEGVRLFRGDILDTASLSEAMKGCESAFHTAAFAGAWARDPGTIYRLNVDGALNVFRAASEQGIGRLVVTSTAGILGPSERDALHEESPPPNSYFTHYEESKYRMEQSLMAAGPDGPGVVIVNPTRVFGPGVLSEANGVTRMIRLYMEGKWRLVPGNGQRLGNYVFVEDVVAGHLLAMERGRPGQRYILGGENISYNRLFGIIRQLTGAKYRLFHIPLWLMLATADGIRAYSMMTGRPPLITRSLVRKYNHDWIVSSDKAASELDYRPLSAEEGIRRTIEWLSLSFVNEHL